MRRDFVRVGKGFPELKEWALSWLDSIRQLYHLNRERLRPASDTTQFTAVDALLRQQVQAMVAQRDCELNNVQLREPCRKALMSLTEHWSGFDRLHVDSLAAKIESDINQSLSTA